jgi:integrase
VISVDVTNLNLGDISEIRRYTKHLESCNKSPAARVYLSLLSSFACWIGKRGKTFDTFMLTDIQEYFSNIPNAHTANQFLSSVKGYMRFRCATIPLNDTRSIMENQRLSQLSLVNARPKTVNRERKSLNTDEISELLDEIKKRNRTKLAELITSGTILQFYFGGRPIEIGYWLRTSGVEHPAKIDWENNEMQLWTAKVNFYRYLPWAPGITPHLKRWCAAIPQFANPNAWLTDHLGEYTINNLHVTSYTGRRTFQTQMRLAGVEDVVIDTILGHTTTMADRYTDFGKFNEKVKNVMTTEHYMVKAGIL